MKRSVSLVAVILAIIMLFSACSSKKEVAETPSGSVSSEETKKTALQLLYCSSDTLNPYNTKSKINAEIGRLIYEPLFSLSNEFEAVPTLAEALEKKEKVCRVKLTSALFSDGAPVTSEDVLASYALARESELYKHLFYNIESLTAEGSYLVFTMKEYDPYFENMLTFPIIKKGSDTLTDSDHLPLPPIGSGRFVYSKEDESLKRNEKYRGKTSIDKISLVDAPDSEAVTHYVEVGATDIYYTDPSGGGIIRMSGNKVSLNMNNLVYIGVNHSDPQLCDPVIRHAISSAIDRNVLCAEPFFGNALAASGFFHPDFAPTKGYQSIQPTADSKICIENLEEIGYNRLDKEGCRVNEKGSALEFSLLVNEGNTSRIATAELIKSQLAVVGIKIDLKVVSTELYRTALAEGNFQLYLGEVKVSQNMGLSELVSPGGTAAFGLMPPNDKTEPDKGSEPNKSESAEELIFSYPDVLKGVKEGIDPVSSLATALVTDLPQIPLLYRSSLLFYSDNISSVGDASGYDLFLSINSFKNS